MLSIPQLAAVLERARDAALPGRECCARDGVLRELRELLQPVTPPKPPLRLVR
jgi:hypothetical protein